MIPSKFPGWTTVDEMKGKRGEGRHLRVYTYIWSFIASEHTIGPISSDIEINHQWSGSHLAEVPVDPGTT